MDNKISNNQNSKKMGGRYVSPTPGAIPIVANTLIPSSMYTQAVTTSYIEFYKKAIDAAVACGFNVAGLHSHIKSVTEFLKK